MYKQGQYPPFQKKRLDFSLLSVGELAAKLGVTSATIRRWCRSGKRTETLRTVGNHRRFASCSFSHLIKKEERRSIGYARVSSHDQKSDLQSQIQRLKDSGCDEVISDLGSGLNCKRPGLKKLLEAIWSSTVSSLTLTHADRLLRFGKELVFYWCKQFNVSIQTLDDPEGEAFETELVKDVITLMTVFSTRLYGKRSWKNRRALE